MVQTLVNYACPGAPLPHQQPFRAAPCPTAAIYIGWVSFLVGDAAAPATVWLPGPWLNSGLKSLDMGSAMLGSLPWQAP